MAVKLRLLTDPRTGNGYNAKPGTKAVWHNGTLAVVFQKGPGGTTDWFQVGPGVQTTVRGDATITGVDIDVAGSGGLSDGDYGDVTVSGGGTVINIDAGVVGGTELAAGAVDNSKLANMPALTVKGNDTGGSATPQDLTVAELLAMGLGGGGSANKGTAELDFGAFPGASDASVAVTGQAAIASDSVVMVKIRPVATADHTADEHLVEELRVEASDIIAGTGFTIRGFCTGQGNSPRFWKDPPHGPAGPERPTGDDPAPRLYGRFTVGWMWA